MPLSNVNTQALLRIILAACVLYSMVYLYHENQETRILAEQGLANGFNSIEHYFNTSFQTMIMEVVRDSERIQKQNEELANLLQNKTLALQSIFKDLQTLPSSKETDPVENSISTEMVENLQHELKKLNETLIKLQEAQKQNEASTGSSTHSNPPLQHISGPRPGREMYFHTNLTFESNPVGDGKRYGFVTVGDAKYSLMITGLFASLERVQSKAERLVIESASLKFTNKTREVLQSLGVQIHTVTPLNVSDAMKASPWKSWEKLIAWNLTEYDKLVLVDADTVALDNVDELFNFPDGSTSAHWNTYGCPPKNLTSKDMSFLLTSGVIVLEPNVDTFNRLLTLAHKPGGKYPGGDQQLFQAFYNRSEWTPLPLVYDVVPVSCNCTSYGKDWRPRFAHLAFTGAKPAWFGADTMVGDYLVPKARFETQTCGLDIYFYWLSVILDFFHYTSPHAWI